MKTFLYLIGAAVLMSVAGCARDTYRGGYHEYPEYQTGRDEMTIPPREPEAYQDQQFPHVQHY